ncbi:MAG: hypothetical protein JJT96_11690 [Opitutales bacterium]|nr:hypothetical protein [Opitutales bacterium]
MTTANTISTEEILTKLNLDGFFGDDALRYDLVDGTVFNPVQTRQIYLSTDLLRGIYLALKEEAGPAWTAILKNCGRIWGSRVVRNLEREFQYVQQMNPGELPVTAFIALIERYFAAHGWGRAEFDMSLAASHGIVSMRLRNSLLCSVIEDEDGPVDSLIAGILQGIFSHYSGQPLDCAEIASSRQGYQACWFVVSHEDRIGSLPETGDPEKLFAGLKG